MRDDQDSVVTANHHIQCSPVTAPEEGRGQEAGRSSCQDSQARLVRQISLHLLSDLSISLDLWISTLENKLRFQPVRILLPAWGLTRVSLVLDCLKNKQFHCENLQEVNCQNYQLFSFPSDSKEEGTTHWVFPCNCGELYWNFKLNCQPVTGPAGKTVVILTGLTGPSSPSNPAGQNYATLFVREVEMF